VVGIKRPNYLCKAEVPSRIFTDCPDVKLIVVLRNPVERAISSYYHQIKYGTLPPLDIEDGLSNILNEAIQMEPFARGKEVLDFGLYNRALSRYFEYFQREDLLILFHEEVTKDPLSEIKKCYQFLEISEDFTPKKLLSRPQKVIYSIPRLRWLTMRNKYLYSYNESLTRLWQRRLSMVDYIIVAFITGVDRFILSFIFSTQKKEVSSELRERLLRFYTSDIRSLEILLGKDLSKWR
jgi:hypothetical protein